MPRKHLVPTLALALALCLTVGCKNDTPPAPQAPQTPASTTDESAYVEPLVPRTTALVSAEIVGKVAEEKAPLPPVADLEGRIEFFVKKLDTNLEDLAGTKDYKADNGSLLRDVNALALIALAIGMSEEDGKFKKAAPGIVEAAMAVEKATTLKEAQDAGKAVKDALTSEGDPSKLAWTKVASLTPVMLAVPNISSNITTNSNTEGKLKKRGQKATIEGTAALAAIVQGSIANYEETDKAGTKEQWETLCREFRDHALKANEAVHKFAAEEIDYAAASKALEDMRANCDACHKVFHQAAIGQN